MTAPTFTQEQVDYLAATFSVRAPTRMATTVNDVVLILSASARSFAHSEMINHLQSLVDAQVGRPKVGAPASPAFEHNKR